MQPTEIYWLVDVRPAILALWPAGLPFYCGKTVQSLPKRFGQHISLARHPRTYKSPLVRRMIQCGEHVRIVRLETAGADWVEREQHWIMLTRAQFPDVVNTTDGGEGTPGHVQSVETRERIADARRRLSVKRRFAEHRERIAAARRAGLRSLSKSHLYVDKIL